MRKLVKPIVAGMAILGLSAMACIAGIADGSFDDNSVYQAMEEGSFDDNSVAEGDVDNTYIDDEAIALFACVDNEDGINVSIGEDEVPL